MQYRMVGGDRKEYGPISEEQLRQWVTEGRANGDTLIQAEGGVWRKLSTYPEFADVLPSASPPAAGALPPLGGSPPPTPSLPAVYPTDARAKVQAPAIALIVLGLLSLPVAGLGLVSSLFGDPMAYRQAFEHAPELRQFEHVIEVLEGGVGLTVGVLHLLLAALVTLAGFRMLSLRNYALCVIAAVISIIPCFTPCPCCCLGIPIGIWALIVLLRDEVKAAFM